MLGWGLLTLLSRPPPTQANRWLEWGACLLWWAREEHRPEGLLLMCSFHGAEAPCFHREIGAPSHPSEQRALAGVPGFGAASFKPQILRYSQDDIFSLKGGGSNFEQVRICASVPILRLALLHPIEQRTLAGDPGFRGFARDDKFCCWVEESPGLKASPLERFFVGLKPYASTGGRTGAVVP